MTRTLNRSTLGSALGTLLSMVLVLGLGAGCNKPTEENCRKALSNMQVLMGTEHVSKNEDLEGEVRRCKGGSSREAVDCAMKATSLDELRACKFMRVSSTPTPPPKAPVPAGSAAP